MFAYSESVVAKIMSRNLYARFKKFENQEIQLWRSITDEDFSKTLILH